MTYRKIRISAAPEELDALADRLGELGITELEISDPADLEIFEGDNSGYGWNYVDEEVLVRGKEASVSFYLPEGEALSAGAEELLRGYEVTESEVDDSLWMDNLQGYFVPTRYGEHVVVKPDWAEYEAEKDDIVIDIDPGQAFGTGSSPTTSLALQLLEKRMRRGARVLDVGCGTGILAILAAGMGASAVRAVDIDPLAVECSLKNVELNGCSGKVTVEQRDLVKGLDFTADIIAANLTVDILERLLETLGTVAAPGCLMIASGIIRHKEREGREALEKAGFRIEETVRDEEWVAFAAVRDADPR